MTQRKPTIGIVDDDASVCRALKRLIRSVGMDAITCHSGQVYLDLMASVPSFRIDCLILDLQMPGLSGLQLQARIAGSGIPIIFVTAHDEVGAREAALLAGAIAFIRKPFDEDILIATIHSALSLNSQTPPEDSLS